ncbi:hypothetical protein M0813_12546 [Anaeramoeba flamelloides]|uniref:NTF2 domain-containing protein n=1 Tax=Anaeramoeba flamelloides TaxID=1746091 RepID=A0ABQ8ZBU8_9EUKA|nr:hypothetical protein M0813_12546 [Anaeramoeba flamelloides]
MDKKQKKQNQIVVNNFLKAYFYVLTKSTIQHLIKFYTEESTYSCGIQGSMKLKMVKGIEDIKTSIRLESNQETYISDVMYTPIGDQGNLLVSITGAFYQKFETDEYEFGDNEKLKFQNVMENKNREKTHFHRTFVLKYHSKKRNYSIFNDILRYHRKY